MPSYIIARVNSRATPPREVQRAAKPLSFLFLNQFYPPDAAPTGHMLHDVALELIRRGHQVRVICSRRAYATGQDLGPGAVEDGVEVTRVRGLSHSRRSWATRVGEDATYFIQAAMKALVIQPRPDVVLAASTPPFIGLVGTMAGRVRGIAHAHWTMDLFPDALEAHWDLEAGSLPSRLLSGLARLQFARAALILSLGRYQAERVSRHAPANHVEHVPLWSTIEAASVDRAATDRLRRARGWRENDLVLLYSGNMGRGHRLSEFLTAAGRLDPPGAVWAFIGIGPRRNEVETFRREHPSARIELLPYVSAEEVGASLGSADVHLVSLSSGWEGAIVPSKLQTAFSIGRPVVFVGPTDNEIANSIRDSAGGWVVPEGDVEELLRAVREAGDRAERDRRGDAALKYARIHFDRKTNCPTIAGLLEKCVEQHVGPPRT